MTHAALETYLLPFKAIFEEDGVNEVMINQPGEAWVEKAGDQYQIKIPEIDMDHLLGLGRLVAQSTSQTISEETPLLSATLPNGYRIQIVFPPAVEQNFIAFSIRKGSSMHLTLDKYAEMGAFDNTSTKELVNNDDVVLLEYLNAGNVKDFIKHAVLCKKKYNYQRWYIHW